MNAKVIIIIRFRSKIFIHVPSYLYICMVVKYVAKNVRFEGNNS